MSVATLVTRGGLGSFGSPSFIITRGLGAYDATVTQGSKFVDPNHGKHIAIKGHAIRVPMPRPHRRHDEESELKDMVQMYTKWTRGRSN